MELLIATKNPGKAAEIREIFEGLEGQFKLLSLLDFDVSEDFLEDENSFEKNALGKAQFFFDLLGIPAMADDSGILVEALKGELGVKTRRWGAGERATDEEWMEYFLRRMDGEENREARFVCAAAFVSDEHQKVFLGETMGHLERELKAPLHPGIPLSSLFVPEGHEEVYSALPIDQKNAVSHRGKAFQELKNFLTQSLC